MPESGKKGFSMLWLIVAVVIMTLGTMVLSVVLLLNGREMSEIMMIHGLTTPATTALIGIMLYKNHGLVNGASEKMQEFREQRGYISGQGAAHAQIDTGVAAPEEYPETPKRIPMPTSEK